MTELEKIQRAKDYILNLANGIDPITNAELPNDTSLNNVRLSRCFFYVADILNKIIENGGEIGKKYIVKTLPFNISPEQIEKIEISEEPVGVSILAKRIALVLDDNVKPLSAVQISNWMVKKEYLSEIIEGNKKKKLSTPKGENLGVFTVDSTNMNGIPYKKNIYNSTAQRFVLDNLFNIANPED